MASGEAFSALKVCADCQQRKPLDQFPVASARVDGRASYCRPCMNARHVVYRDNKRTTARVRRTAPPAAGHKWCARCRQELPTGAFGKNRSSRDGRTTYCLPCHAAAGRETRDRAGGSRNYHLKRRYGITAAEYDAMVEAQGGLCVLCRERPPEHVDHDHMTGTIRGVLCSCCNQGLGNFRDSIATMRAAIDYLETTTWQKTRVCTGVYRLTSPRPAARPSATSSEWQHLISSLRAAVTSRPE